MSSNEAVYFDGTPSAAQMICNWASPQPDPSNIGYTYDSTGVSDFMIIAANGDKEIKKGDWVIRTKDGLFWVVSSK